MTKFYYDNQHGNGAIYKHWVVVGYLERHQETCLYRISLLCHHSTVLSCFATFQILSFCESFAYAHLHPLLLGLPGNQNVRSKFRYYEFGTIKITTRFSTIRNLQSHVQYKYAVE